MPIATINNGDVGSTTRSTLNAMGTQLNKLENISHILYCTTTNATVTRLTSDGLAISTSNSIPIAINQVMLLRIFATYVVTGGTSGTVGNMGSFDLACTMKRNTAGTVSMLLGPSRLSSTAGARAAITLGTAFAPYPVDGTAYNMTLNIDDTNKCLLLSGTGAANVNIKWEAHVFVTEVVV
jgi:hypothetical protein